MEETWTNIPRSIGWFMGGNYHRVYHLIVADYGDHYLALCKRKLKYPLTGGYWPWSKYPEPLCKACVREIAKWQLANAVEP